MCDVSPKDGKGLEREESGVIILGNLGEVCLSSKRQVTSASVDSKMGTRSLTKPILSFLDAMQVFYLHHLH